MGPTELWSIISKVLRDLSRKFRGDVRFGEGVDYSAWHVLRVYFLLAFEGLTPSLFYRKLKEDKGFRRRWRLPNRLISESQFNQRVKTAAFERALGAVLGEMARRLLKTLGPETVRVVAMDLTRVESNPRRDGRGAWGRDSKGSFYGYKLGLIVSEAGVVLGAGLIRANWGEFNISGRLLRMARETLHVKGGSVEVAYLACDSGFDGESTHRKVRQHLRARALCPPRRRRNPKARSAKLIQYKARRYTPLRYANNEFLATPEGRELYRKRTGIERVNGQLKDTGIRIDDIPRYRRGIKRLRPWVLAKLVIYNAALYANALEGRELRRIKHLVA